MGVSMNRCMNTQQVSWQRLLFQMNSTVTKPFNTQINSLSFLMAPFTSVTKTRTVNGSNQWEILNGRNVPREHMRKEATRGQVHGTTVTAELKRVAPRQLVPEQWTGRHYTSSQTPMENIVPVSRNLSNQSNGKIFAALEA